MEVSEYNNTLRKTIEYMKEMDISKEDRRGFIEDCYSCMGKLAGFPYILEEKTKNLYENSNLKKESATNALEKYLDNKASEIIVNSQNNEFLYDDMFW